MNGKQPTTPAKSQLVWVNWAKQGVVTRTKQASVFILHSDVALSGLCASVGGLTTQAQRPGPRGRPIATWTRWPGSLQRMVRRLVATGNPNCPNWLTRRCRQPFLNWRTPIREHAGTIRERAGTVRECRTAMLLVVENAHGVKPPNDPSSATRPTRASDCNLDAMAGFAAAHG